MTSCRFVLLGVAMYVAYGALASSFGSRLVAQSGNTPIDGLADTTHGYLKWSHGGFLYTSFSPDNGPPIFYTLDRGGTLVSSVTLEIPNADRYWYASVDRANDGTIIFAGGVDFAAGQVAPVIAWIPPDHSGTRVVQTYPYYAQMISIAPDGTLWTIGEEMIDHNPLANGLDPTNGILRHFDKTGRLIGSFFPQAEYIRTHSDLRVTSGFLVATRDRLGWLSPREGKRAYYVEVLLPSMKMVNVAARIPVGDSLVRGFALTDGGVVSVCVEDSTTEPFRKHYRLDRTQQKWISVEVPRIGTSPFPPNLLGNDGEQLVLKYGQSAAFAIPE